MQSFISVPFKTESGLSSVNGVAKFSPAGIVLEFESKFFGLISTGVKEVRLAVAEILDVKFKKGMFRRGARIEIRTTSFSKLSELPNSEGKITLKLLPDDFERGRDAVARLQGDMTEHIESLPPSHSPLSELFDEGEEETQELKERPPTRQQS
jgi:hypothetical protein